MSTDDTQASDRLDAGLDDPDRAERPCTGAAHCRVGGTGLTVDQLRSLPVAFAFDPVVPRAFGISRSAAYRALAAGELPIRPLRLGRRLIVRRSDLLSALGITESRSDAPSGP